MCQTPVLNWRCWLTQVDLYNGCKKGGKAEVIWYDTLVLDQSLALLHVWHINTHNPFNGPLSTTTRESRYQKGKTNLDFTEAKDSEWQWNLLGHMQVCTSHQTDNDTSTPPLSFLQAGCSSCRPTNSVKATKAMFGILTRSQTKLLVSN